jgi:signal recognition particle subunit SRP54
LPEFETFITPSHDDRDEALMTELRDLKKILPPYEILLEADAMLGQQSVNVAEGFHKTLGLTGLILTKVDGDARGGAALSVREVTAIPRLCF